VAAGTRKALILPGAGARGAYQVGVLKAIAEIVPEGACCPFRVLSGTSAGAINAAVLASRAENFRKAVREMEAVWANFEVSQVFKADAFSMLKSSLHWLFAIVFGGLGRHTPISLLDSSPLEALLARRIRFPRIERALRRRLIDALAVTASAYTSARSVTFFQANDNPEPWSRSRRIGRPDVIRLEHLMASAAVPFIFRPVRVGTEYYGDGSMRHRAPLSAAIHLGAPRLLIIGVRDERPDPEPPPGSTPKPPSFAHLAGYMLDTLFMDGLYSDIERATRINRMLDQLTSAGLADPISGVRRLDGLVILPSRDIREIAGRHAGEMPLAMRLLLKGIGAGARDGRQLVSYLLFESGYTRELIELGYRDGMSRSAELADFLFDREMDGLEAPSHVQADIEP
jgi:NTE family protein